VARVERWLAGYRERGMAMIWVSHDPEQIERVADRAYRLRAGALEPAA
jgi:ABC-type glutathione transport system ATPase component